MGYFRKKKHEGFIDRLKAAGMTDEEIADLQSMNREDALAWFTNFQQRLRDRDANSKKLDLDTVPEIGKEISWLDTVEMAFRVLAFDRNGTIYEPFTDPKAIKAKSMLQPYGYLLVESPALNQAVRLPIIHNNDFWLASSVFDEPELSNQIGESRAELLVTYKPKKIRKNGMSGSPHHVLHYSLCPVGTLDKYYSDDEQGDGRMTMPESELLFGPFIYKGQIQVFMNSSPKL